MNILSCSSSLAVAVVSTLVLICTASPLYYLEPSYYPYPDMENQYPSIDPCIGRDYYRCMVGFEKLRRDMAMTRYTTSAPSQKRNSELINAIKSLPKDMVLNGR